MNLLKSLWNGLQLHVWQSRKSACSLPRPRCIWAPPVLAAASVLVLGCWIAVAAGKGKPGAGNQPIPGAAHFLSGDVVSNGLLLADWVDHGTFETLNGQLADEETLKISGSPGDLLIDVNNALEGDLLSAAAVVDELNGTVCFSGASWELRLDFTKEPLDRVQLTIRWFDVNGLIHRFDMGRPPFSELFPVDFGEVTAGVSPRSLTDATVVYAGDPFQVVGAVPTGRGKKTAQVVYSSYYDSNGLPQDGTSSCEIETFVP